MLYSQPLPFHAFSCMLAQVTTAITTFCTQDHIITEGTIALVSAHASAERLTEVVTKRRLLRSSATALVLLCFYVVRVEACKASILQFPPMNWTHLTSVRHGTAAGISPPEADRIHELTLQTTWKLR